MASNFKNAGQSLQGSSSKLQFPRPVRRADLNAWMKPKVLPLSSFSTEEDLINSDIAIFREYQSLRQIKFKTTGYRKAEDLKGSGEGYVPEAMMFLEYLEGTTHYRNTKSEDLDKKKFKKFLDARIQEFRRMQASKNDQSESSNKSQQAQTSPQAISVKEQVEKKTTSTEAQSTQEEQPSQEKPKDTSTGTKQVIFPAMMLVKRAIEKQKQLEASQETRKQEPSYEELQTRVQELERKSLELADELQNTYRENSHLISKGEFPEEIQDRIDELTKAKQENIEKHKRIKLDCRKHVEKQIMEVLNKHETEINLESIYEDKDRDSLITTNELEKLVDKYWDASVDESSKRIDLFHLMEHSALDLDKVQEIAEAIISRDIKQAYKLLKKLDVYDSDGYLINEDALKELCKDLNIQSKRVEKSRELFSTLNDEKIVEIVSTKIEGMETKKVTNDDMDNLSSMIGLFLRAKIRIARKEQNPEAEKHFQNYLSKLSLVYDQEAPQIALDYRLGDLYRDTRITGTEKPRESLSGIKHDYQATAETAQKSYGQIAARTSLINEGAKDEYDNWAWFNRAPDSLDHKMLGENYERMSARVIASPELIKTLDDLSIKHRFTYKVPAKEKNWSRADTLTIYFINENVMSFETVEIKSVSKKAKQEIAQALQPYIFTGDDKQLLGKTIPDDTGKPYKGVSFSAQANETNIVELAARAYAISDKLGEFVLNSAQVSLGHSGFSFKTSLGGVHSLNLLLNEIEKLCN